MSEATALAARGVAAAVYLRAPDRLVRRVVGRDLSPGEELVARILGARHVVEVALLRMTPRVAPFLAAVDALHAASMIAVAALSPSHRRAALASATVAASLAASSLAGSAHTP